MTGDPTHDCPGCGKSGIPFAKLACGACWNRLPRRFKDKIRYHWARFDAQKHARACAIAIAWWENNPR